MPSSAHAPIKKYNYERSLFRWVMSRHPERFEKHGITTRTLERTPLAREAFYSSEWPGAKILVQGNDESKYERTPFFDNIIERGLKEGTRFSIEHVISEEKITLGISLDPPSGKFYLDAFGSPKGRRSPNRRGSPLSSEADVGELQHPVVKEISNRLSVEIGISGEHPEIRLDKVRTTAGPTRGSKIIHFEVSIESAGTAFGGGMGGRDAVRASDGRSKGAEVGAPMMISAQTAGVGKGNTATAPPLPPPRPQVSLSSATGEAVVLHLPKDGVLPRQQQQQQADMRVHHALGGQGVQPPKLRNRRDLIAANGSDGLEALAVATQQAPKKHRILASPAFTIASSNPSSNGTAKSVSELNLSQVPTNGWGRNLASGIQCSYLPGALSILTQPCQQTTVPSCPSGGCIPPALRVPGHSTGGVGFNGLSRNCNRRAGMVAMTLAASAQSPVRASVRKAGGFSSNMHLNSTWQAQPAAAPIRSNSNIGLPSATGTSASAPLPSKVEEVEITRSVSGMGRGGSLLSQEQRQVYFPERTSFGIGNGSRTFATTALQRVGSPTAVSSLDPYSALVKQQSLQQATGNKNHLWSANDKNDEDINYVLLL